MKTSFYSLKLLVFNLFIISLVSSCSTYTDGNKEKLVASKADSLPEYVDFNIHIKPILSDRCFVCHGPDANNRKGNLRLDTKEGAFAALGEKKDHYALVAGDPDKSELYNRLVTSNPAEVMPVPASNLKVSDMEIALIKKWIEQGAEWKQHWSFISAKKQEVPKVKNSDWPVNPIDNFILAKLEREGLKPSAEANKETLIRRLSLDLRGLPPTIEEVDAFLADKSPKAYENLVNKFLSSEAYGERMAADWMDVARYADSHGYQDDGYRNSWYWRDWVIKAFNKNMPFDQFTTWQLAGDLLPNATKEQKLATGFNRNHALNQEGGIVDEEYRVEYVLDRANTVSKAFLGLTMECSRCHDHKYDPLTQKEYYQFSAFFNQNEEVGQIANYGIPHPTILNTDAELEKKLSFINEKISSKKQEIETVASTSEGSFEKWLKESKTKKLEANNGLIAYLPLDKLTLDYNPRPTLNYNVVTLSKEVISGKPLDQKPQPVSKVKEKPQPQPIMVPKVKEIILPNLADKNYPAKLNGDTNFVPGKFNNAIEFNNDNSLSFHDGFASFERTNPFTYSFWLNVPNNSEVNALIGNILDPVDGYTGYGIHLNKGKITARLISSYPGNAIEITSKKLVALKEWHHVAVTYDGSSKASGLKIYIDGKASEVEVEKDKLYKTIKRYAGVSLAIGVSAGRGITPFKGGKMDELKVYNRDLTSIEIESLAGIQSISALLQKQDISQEEKKELKRFYLANFSKEYNKKLEELQKLRDEENALTVSIEEIMVMEERRTPRETFLLIRGAYDAHGEKVKMGTPKSVGVFPKSLPQNRLGLAMWLTDPKNPLVSRVTVNRYWQQYFGAGIVTSSDDFGSQGTLPTHPELLDWLATRFIESGWDIKGMQKLIVMSATYRQSSKVTKELLAKDPQNLLYTRGPRQRMPFEMVRDNALAASNLLTKKVGGPSVRPYQPEGLWEEKTSGRFLTYYEQDHGENLYRRSLYTFFKRTSPPPTMMTFDAPERSACYVKRRNTNTPLQALVTLNDKQFIEASRVLAERMIKEGGSSLEDQITFAYRATLSRYPSKKEIEILTNLYHKEVERFNNDEKSAKGLLSVGEKKADEQIKPAELAANAIVASTILNLDETITKQ